MKREFTKLMAALALLLFIAPLGMWGQTRSEVTLQYSGSTTTNMTGGNDAATLGLDANAWSVVGNKGGNNNFPGLNKSGYIALYYSATASNTITVTNTAGNTISSIAITYTSDSYNNGKVIVGGSEVTGTSGTYSINATSFVVTNGNTSSVQVRIKKIVITYGSGGTPTTPCDIALTNAPVTLSFDLYNNNAAQTISYTTSSTGTVSVANNDFVNATVNQQAKTITVTPVAVTNGNQSIYVNQGADATYLAGSTSFIVNIIDSTPGVVFVAGTDEGTNGAAGHSDSMTKDVVTISSTNAAFATEQYRLYQDSETTISVSAGYTITSIVFNGQSTSYPVDRLSTTNGGYSVTENVGTWTGNSSSVTFTASAQARASRIRVVVEQDNTPTIAVNPASLDAFSYLSTSEDPSDAQSVSIAGSNLTDDITVSVGNNSNFEISLAENSGYTNMLTLTETDGSVSATAVYVRMKSGLSVGTYSGNLAITSTDASQVDIELDGSVAAVNTVPQAIAAIDEATGHTVSGAYVSGVVSYVEYFSTTNHYITYYISADGSRVNELEVFHGKNLNGTDFTAQSDLLVGDEVVIYGNLKLYDNTVYEFDADNYLVSFNRPAAQEYTLTVSNLSHVNMFVFDASDDSEMLFEGEGTAQIYNGTSVLLSVEVDEGYGLQSLIVDGVNVASQLDETDAYTFYMPTRNVTITATAQALPVVILRDDNTTLYGTNVTLPSRENSGNYTFAGWCVTNYEDETTTAPDIISAGAYNNTQQSIVLYPVYTRTEGGSGAATEWHLLNNLSDADAGVYALLTTDNYAFNGVISNQGHGGATSGYFTFVNGVATSAPTGTLEVTFIPVEENGSVVGYKMYAEDKGFLYAKKKASGNLAWVSTDNKYWSVHVSGNWYYPASDGAAYLRSYSNNSFRTYGQNNGELLKLAKKVQGGGTTYYTSLLSTYTQVITGYGSGHEEDAANYYLVASPVGAFTPLAENGFLTAAYDLYRFDQNGGEGLLEWVNFKAAPFTLAAGEGYLYASESQTTLTFTGVPYNGDGKVTLSKVSGVRFEGWNLVGNPFAQTAYTDRDCYVMNQNHNQIIAASNREVAIMQGVFVIANSDGEQMTFSTTAPNAGAKVIMNVNDNQGVADRAIVRFGEGRQLPKFQLNQNSTKVYFSQGNQDYAVVRSGNEGELPVNFKAEKNGSYTINVETENVEMNYLHLIDYKTGADVDLLKTPSYTFQASTGDNAYRFRLVFDANSVQENNTTANFAYFNGSEWVVNNMGEATLQVVDMMGRVLSSETLNGNTTFTLNQVPGVYMFRLVNGNDVKVQKVVVR